MNFKIPVEVLNIYKKIEDAKFEVFFVGGCVRNMLLEKPVKDWDITTNAKPEDIIKLFPDGFYDNQFGTVGVPTRVKNEELRIKNNEGVTRVGEPKKVPAASEASDALLGADERQDPEEHNTVVEITTYRTEREYKDFRHPVSVEWGKTIHEDLERRDFTINAMALKINLSISSLKRPHPNLLLKGEGDQGKDFTLIDPFHGQEDLKNKIVKAVGDASKRFKEDALRLMRAIRFATQFSFTIEEHTWNAIKEDAMVLPAISSERIRDELLKILSSDFPYEGIMLLKNANLLQYILPELMEGVGLSQVRPGRHHVYDVFTHNILALKLCPSIDPIVRFATLIHDVGKSRVVGKDEDGLVIFYNHEIKGAQMAYEICERLHFSKKDRNKIVNLIRWHMFSVDEHVSDAGVRRFIRRVGVENVKDMIDLRIGDRLGSGIPEERAESWRLKKFKERIEQQLMPAPFSINDLAIDGNDIIHELNIKPGPQIGQILQKLFEEVDEDLTLNTREYLLNRLHEMNNK